MPIQPTKQEDGGYAFETVLLSGEPISTYWRGRFVIDLDTLRYHKPRLAVDYNHNDEIIIGYGEDFRVTPEGLKSTGKLIAGEFTDTIVNLAKHGVPFEASVCVELDAGTAAEVGAGAEVTVNGKTHQGPLTVYSQSLLRGYAICPHGADKFTNFTLLKKEQEYLMSKPRTLKQSMSDAAETVLSETALPGKKVKDPILAEFCEVFGKENGLELYQSDASIDEVRQYQSLHAKFGQYLTGLSKEDEEKPDEEKGGEEKKPDDEEESEDKPDDKKKEDEKLSSAVLEKLSAMEKRLEAQAAVTQSQSAELVKLHSLIPKGAEPVSHGQETANKSELKKTSVDRYAAKYKTH